MLDQDGSISFVDEILSAIDNFLSRYEEVKGPLRNELEKGLIISYALGVIHCDLEAIWECLGKAPVFGPLHPKMVFNECVGEKGTLSHTRIQKIADELSRRGWLPLDEG